MFPSERLQSFVISGASKASSAQFDFPAFPRFHVPSLRLPLLALPGRFALDWLADCRSLDLSGKPFKCAPVAPYDPQTRSFVL